MEDLRAVHRIDCPIQATPTQATPTYNCHMYDNSLTLTFVTFDLNNLQEIRYKMHLLTTFCELFKNLGNKNELLIQLFHDDRDTDAEIYVNYLINVSSVLHTYCTVSLLLWSQTTLMQESKQHAFTAVTSASKH